MSLRIPSRLARTIDYTNVKKDATYADVERTCLEAQTHGVAAVVVPSALVQRAARHLDGSNVLVGCYIGYPFGTPGTAVKAREADTAVADGAREIELVPHFGAIRARRWRDVERELAAVRAAIGKAVFNLVAEESVLTDEELMSVAHLAADAGCMLIANTAGFRIVSTRPETEATATVHAVERLLRAGMGSVRPKAAGGIRTAAEITDLVDAGAERVAIPADSGALRRLAEEWQGGE